MWQVRQRSEQDGVLQYERVVAFHGEHIAELIAAYERRGWVRLDPRVFERRMPGSLRVVRHTLEVESIASSVQSS